MPILLDTPHTYDPGAGYEVQVSGFVLITHQGLDTLERALTIQCQYGNVVNGVWMSSDAPAHRVVIRNLPPEQVFDYNELGQLVPVNMGPPNNVFDDFIDASLTADAGLRVWDEAGRHLYQYLIDEGIYEGTIV